MYVERERDWQGFKMDTEEGVGRGGGVGGVSAPGYYYRGYSDEHV